ncbi:MAG: FG-GAP-like repeat-containing protein [Verrucomicrobia bacterium]|nr:FG-GAP-like repeat-containing protein [Verrucomicrobiota bacterium]
MTMAQGNSCEKENCSHCVVDRRGGIPGRFLAAILAGASIGFLIVPGAGCRPSTTPPVQERLAPAQAPLEPGSIVSEALSPRDDSTAVLPLFESLSSDRTGVDFVNSFLTNHPLSLLNLSGFVCGGVCIGDVSGDGRPDLFLVSGPGKNRLYVQAGDLKFNDITEGAQVSGGEAWGAGAAMVDIDNDGDLDIYVCNYDAPNQLFLNEGNGKRFIESARRFGLDLVDASLMPAFADYDNDGDLDVFVLTHRYYQPEGRPDRPPVGFKNGKPFVLPEFEKYYDLRQVGPNNYTADTCGRADYLFRNNGNGTFSDVSREAGIRERGHGYSATWWDYDNDGWVDLYVGNDFTDPDHLYRNNGNGTFTDVIAAVMPFTTWSSMGADCADLNNDGLLDFMSADMAATTHFKTMIAMGDLGDRRWFLENAWPRQSMRNCVFLNTGTGRFMEIAFMAGLAKTDWTWAVKMADFDNDGRVDLFATNGSSRMNTDADFPVPPGMLIGRTEWDIWKDMPLLKEQNLAFRNEGDLHFVDSSRNWGLDHVGMSYSAAYGDLDGDGDLDLVVANLDEPVSIYRNRGTRGHRVMIQLRGTVSNRSGTGAVVRLETASGGKQIRQMNPVTGFLSSNEPVLHFGLGGAEIIDRLSVTWPSGREQSFSGLASDLRYTITEPSESVESGEERVARPETQFSEVALKAGLKFEHREKPYDDFQRQPLLSAKHSRLGGGMAWGDADGDGDDDLFVSGASGQGGRLFLNQGNGRFAVSAESAALFDADMDFEDMAALWIDADRDGDLDLLVTSGSVECEPGAPLLEDRLYRNEGAGRFARASGGTLPAARNSSGVAVAGDFDRDGDLDLFVGGRVVPGKYPEIPDSQLLRNDNGVFTDITDELAPGLKRAGMVTGALWSDANGDGWLDLLVACEWGPVKFFANTGGGLQDQTEIAGLQQRIGWWNSVNGVDLDRDGDIDYVVMNAGLNTKYGTPTIENPAILFYGDMDGSGRKLIIEAENSESGLIPIRGLSRSTSALEPLGARFPNHRSYGVATLEAIYTTERLKNAIRLEANHFESGILINDGHARFTWRSFPRFAQTSPGFGVVATELDGDAMIEIQVVENLFSREPETGLWRGGIGVTLKTDARDLFQVVRNDETGLVIDGDAKGLTVCDFNGDGWPDLAVTQNNGRLLLFENRGGRGVKPLAVRLKGAAGNPAGVGARVAVFQAGGRKQTSEIYGGGGYLSQSAAVLYFDRAEASIERVEVRWPSGQSTVIRPSATAGQVVIRIED